MIPYIYLLKDGVTENVLGMVKESEMAKKIYKNWQQKCNLLPQSFEISGYIFKSYIFLSTWRYISSLGSQKD